MDKNDEKVLVVKSETIFKDGIWQGLLCDNLVYYLDLINKNYEFKRRGDVEENNSYQQIIPYVLFKFENKYFLYKYLPRAGEQRLVNTYQLGIGGHINKIDVNRGENVLDVGMMREWQEEVDYKGNILSKKLIGIINDDSKPVEKVHLGLVYLFEGDIPDIFIKETEKMMGELVEIDKIGDYIKDNDGVWVKIVYNEYLKKLL